MPKVCVSKIDFTDLLQLTDETINFCTENKCPSVTVVDLEMVKNSMLTSDFISCFRFN